MLWVLNNKYFNYFNRYCSSPSLEVENDGKVYFPPSFIGVVSK